jgi:hypothetical protein
LTHGQTSPDLILLQQLLHKLPMLMGQQHCQVITAGEALDAGGCVSGQLLILGAQGC